MIAEALFQNQANMITFVMVDVNYTEVDGLGAAFILEISKAGGAFIPSTGAKAEISDGWYSYVLSAAECDTIGPLSVIVNGVGCMQQNLEYVIRARTAGCISFTYTVTDSITLLPIQDVEVWFSTDNTDPPANVVWYGITDAFGVARDAENNTPCLDSGTYFVWKQKVGYTPIAWPDTEVVS